MIDRRISISELSATVRPAKGLLMAMLRGYFDDSKGEGDDAYLTIAGYITTLANWEKFEVMWQDALDRADMPWLHMKEFGSPTGVYAKWYNGECEEEKIAFLQSLIVVVNKCQPHPVSATLRVEDVERFNREYGTKLDAYALALYLCLTELALVELYEQNDFQIILDKVPKGHSKVSIAKSYVASDGFYPRSREVIGGWNITPLGTKFSFRNILPIQAADFLAWEARKSATRRDDWLVNEKPNIPPEKWVWEALMWDANKYGTADIPTGRERKSFIELKRDLPLAGFIWGYEDLVSVHVARGETWG